MKIKTDGTIKPQEAFKKAADILKEHFQHLEKSKLQSEKEKEKKETKQKEEKKEKKKKKSEKSPSDISVQDLELSSRVTNILEDNRIKTVAGLIQRKKESLIDTKGLGKKSVGRIEKALDKYDLSLK